MERRSLPSLKSINWTALSEKSMKSNPMATVQPTGISTKILLAMTLLVPSMAIAGPNGPGLTGSFGAAPAGTCGAFLTFDYRGTGSGVTTGRFRLEALDGAFDVTSIDCKAPFQCPESLAGEFVFSTLDGSEVPDLEEAVRVTFDIGIALLDGAMQAISVSSEQYEDGVGNTILPTGSTAGEIAIQAGPGAGILNIEPATLSLISAINGPQVAGGIVISNDAGPGDFPFTPDCMLGPVTGSGTIIAEPFSALLNSNESVTAQVSCSGSSLGTSTATYSCTRPGFGAKNTTTQISCLVSGALPAPRPAAGSNAQLTFGPLTRGETATRTFTFTEVNAIPIVAYDVACEILGDSNDVFSIEGANSGTVPGGGSLDILVSATALTSNIQPNARMECTYSNGAFGTVIVGLGISLQPETIPSASLWALVVLMFALLGVGAARLRYR